MFCLKEVEKKIIGLVKHELEMYKKILRRQNTSYYRKVKQSKWNLRQGVLNMTLSYLKNMEHEDLADALQSKRCHLIFHHMIVRNITMTG